MIKYVQYPFLWLQSIFQWFGRWISFLLEDKQPDSKKNTIAVLDGVRGVAVLMVMVFHIDRMTGDNLWSRVTYPLSTSISTAGGTGVTLFFVLSGFLLFMPFAKALLYKTRWPLARVFYLRRALRIIPAYYVSLFLIILFSQPEHLHPDHLEDLFLFATFFMDSTRTTFRQINGPFCTLATEWQFYMLLPLICLAIALILIRVPVARRLRAVSFCLPGVLVWDWLNDFLLALGFGACIAAILYGSSGLRRMFEWKPLRWVGLISFSLYIWHLPLLVLFQTRLLPLFPISNRYVSYSLLWLWALLIIFPIAFLSYLIIEKPWMKLGDQWRLVIEKNHKERLKQLEAQVAHQQEAEQRTAVPQEAVTK